GWYANICTTKKMPLIEPRMADMPAPEIRSWMAETPSARSAMSPAEYCRKKFTGRFRMRSQTADWIGAAILRWKRIVATPCVSLNADEARPEATSATPSRMSAEDSAFGMAESNTWPVMNGVTVPNWPTMSAM